MRDGAVSRVRVEPLCPQACDPVAVRVLAIGPGNKRDGCYGVLCTHVVLLQTRRVPGVLGTDLAEGTPCVRSMSCVCLGG